MNAPRKRHRRLIAGIVSAVALLMATTAVVQLKANATWRRMTDTHNALRSNWLNKPGTREPLWGSVTDERAFDHYQKAADMMCAVDEEHESLKTLINKSDEEVAAMARELRGEWQPALAELHAGAHAASIHIAPEDFAHAPMVNLLDYRRVSNAAMFEARMLRHEGKDLESVRVTLDAMSLGADVCNEGLLINQMVGIAMTTIAVEAWTDDALKSLDADAKEAFAKGLAKLDAQLPHRLLTARELLFITETLQEQPSNGEWVAACGSWRYGFSTRWMMADAILITAINYHRMSTADPSDWLGRQRLSNEIAAEVLASGNELAAMLFPNLVSCEKTIRHSLGKVRLLRMALNVHRGVETEPLADPFGTGTLLVEESDDKLLLKSVGSAGHEQLEFTIAR